MKLQEFHNGLRVLMNIDAADLVNAGVLTDDEAGIGEWIKFRRNPWEWMIRADDDRAAKLWALMLKRGVNGEAA